MIGAALVSIPATAESSSVSAMAKSSAGPAFPNRATAEILTRRAKRDRGSCSDPQRRIFVVVGQGLSARREQRRQQAADRVDLKVG